MERFHEQVSYLSEVNIWQHKNGNISSNIGNLQENFTVHFINTWDFPYACKDIKAKNLYNWKESQETLKTCGGNKSFSVKIASQLLLNIYLLCYIPSIGSCSFIDTSKKLYLSRLTNQTRRLTVFQSEMINTMHAIT